MRCDSAALKRNRSRPFVGSESVSMRSSPPLFTAGGAWVGCGCAGGAVVGFGGAVVAEAGAAARVGGAGGAVGGGAWQAARSEDPTAAGAPGRHRRPGRRRRVRP